MVASKSTETRMVGIIDKIYSYTIMLSSNRVSMKSRVGMHLVYYQSFEPYSKIGRQSDWYSFSDVRGCKQPKRDPIEFRAKNAQQ